MEYSIQRNGTFAIKSEKFTLRSCLPGLDNERIMPESFDISQNETGHVIRYVLNGSEWIELSIRHSGGSVSIGSRIFTEGRPYYFCPVQQVAVNNARGLFIQELGLRGQYGYESYDTLYERKVKTTSYGITAIDHGEKSAIFSCNDHTRFANIYTYKPSFENGKEMSLSAGFNLEKTRSGLIEFPEIHIREADFLEQGLHDEAIKTAAEMNARPVKRNTKIWSSWYYNFNFFSQEILEDYLQNFAEFRSDIEFDVIQIDAGYCTPGDWLEPNRMWPKGMKGAFDAIRGSGYMPGIWIAPFVVGNRSRLYECHPDWVIRRPDGRPYAEKTFYEWRKPWPNLSTEYYILDASHPEASEYIISVFRQYREWGAEFFKTDFMLWNMKDTCQIRRFDDSKTSVEIYRELLTGIRSAVGDDAYILGCIAPFLPSVGFADGMRIGGDVFSTWSPVHMGMLAKKFPGSGYFNHVYWENDPDVFIIRDFDTELSFREVESVTFLQALTGGIAGNSSPIHLISDERRDLLRFVLPVKPHGEVVYPFLAETNTELYVRYRENNAGTLLLFNPGEQTVIKKFDFGAMTGSGSAFMYDFHEGPMGRIAAGMQYLEIPPRGCRLFFYDETEEIKECPGSIWYQNAKGEK